MRFFAVSAAFGLILAAAIASGTPARQSAAPRLLERPVIRGSAHAWETLRVSRGKWSGARSVSYQWQRCTAYSHLVNRDGPFALWRMNERRGPTLHDVSYGHDGTFPRHVRFRQRSPLQRPGNGETNSAVQFRGGGAAVIPNRFDFPIADAMTLEAWIKPDRIGRSIPLIARPASGPSGAVVFGLLVDERGRVVFQLRLRESVWDNEGTEFPEAPVRSRRLRTPVPLPSGTWSHLVATYSTQLEANRGDDRGEMRIYVNGELVGFRPAAGRLEETDGSVLLGGLKGQKPSLSGGLDEVAIYLRPLSARRIRQHFEAAAKGCVDIGGANKATYTLFEDDDAGNRIRVRVTATNPSGSTTEYTRDTPAIRLPRKDKGFLSVSGLGWAGPSPEPIRSEWYRTGIGIAVGQISASSGKTSPLHNIAYLAGIDCPRVGLWNVLQGAVDASGPACGNRWFGLSLTPQGMWWSKVVSVGQRGTATELWFAASRSKRGFAKTDGYTAPRRIERRLGADTQLALGDGAYVADRRVVSPPFTLVRLSHRHPALVAFDAPSTLAVFTRTGAIELYSANGTTAEKTGKVESGEGSVFAMRPHDATKTVLLLREGRLDLLTMDGAVAASQPLPAAATYGDDRCFKLTCRFAEVRLADYESPYAVYVHHDAVHVLRMTDGKDVVIAHARRTPIHAQMEEDGLVYSSGHLLTYYPRWYIDQLFGG